MRFVKLHGIGNDFIVVDAFRQAVPDPAALAQRLCARRFGVGADGLILMGESAVADARMRIFNSDGSEPEMCGNGVRCAAKFLFDEGLCRKREMSIDTLAGVKIVDIQPESRRVARVRVDMGAPEFEPARIPVAAESNRIQVSLGGKDVSFFCVSMGNPHAVTFDLFPDEEDFRRFGAEMECHPLFPARANIEFCRVEAADSVRVKVWERGDGPTLACGTGSCAVLAAGVELGLLERSARIHLPGGTLLDEWLEDGRIRMTGPAETVYAGEIEI